MRQPLFAFLGLRCGVPPRQTHEINAVRWSQVADRKNNPNRGIRRGRPLTSQTAFGGQLPYKGSLVRPVARFHHIPFEYNGRLLRATSHYFFHEPRVARSDVVNLNLLPCIGNVHRIHAGRPLGVPYKCGLRGRQAPILFSLSSRGRFRRPGRRTRCCGPGH